MSKQVYDIDYSKLDLEDIYALDVGERFRHGYDLVEVCAHDIHDLVCCDCAILSRCGDGDGCPTCTWYKMIQEGYFACEETGAEGETPFTNSAVDEPRRQTIFDHITESLEVLAAESVYMHENCRIPDGVTSPFIDRIFWFDDEKGDKWDERFDRAWEKAKNATVKKLKEVYNG